MSKKKFINTKSFTQHIFTDENGDQWRFEKINKSTDDGVLKASDKEKEIYKGANYCIKKQMQPDSKSKFVKANAIGCKLKDALYRKTVTDRLYAIYDEWWMKGIVFIDHEDLSTLSLSNNLLERNVKDMEDSAISVSDNHGDIIHIPVTKIYLE